MGLFLVLQCVGVCGGSSGSIVCVCVCRGNLCSTACGGVCRGRSGTRTTPQPLGVYGGTRVCIGAEWEMCVWVEVNEDWLSPHRLYCQPSHLPLMSRGAQIKPQRKHLPLTKKHFHFKQEKQQTKHYNKMASSLNWR